MQGLCREILLDFQLPAVLFEPMPYRMLIKAGVAIDRLKRPVRKILNKLIAICGQYGYDLIITSTYEGTHSAGSLHYADLAVDVDDPPAFKEEITDKIRLALGKDFDVVLESDHIHIEYDPK